ncbi:MAG: hypothetical protein MUC87_07230 [Bacteroidia bacterium]|jgi:hypothetical protein|nr:hypothetical protein [Bacteroidia bacterium]
MKKSMFLLGFALLFSAAMFAQDPPKHKGNTCPNPQYQTGAQAKTVQKAPAGFKAKAGVVRQVKVKPAQPSRPVTLATPKK